MKKQLKKLRRALAEEKRKNRSMTIPKETKVPLTKLSAEGRVPSEPKEDIMAVIAEYPELGKCLDILNRLNIKFATIAPVGMDKNCVRLWHVHHMQGEIMAVAGTLLDKVLEQFEPEEDGDLKPDASVTLGIVRSLASDANNLLALAQRLHASIGRAGHESSNIFDAVVSRGRLEPTSRDRLTGVFLPQQTPQADSLVPVETAAMKFPPIHRLNLNAMVGTGDATNPRGVPRPASRGGAGGSRPATGSGGSKTVLPPLPVGK